MVGAFVVVFVVVVTGVVVAAGVVVGAFVVVALVVVVAVVVVIFIVVVVVVMAGVVVLGGVVVVCMQLISLFLSVSMALYPFSCSTSSGAPTSLLLYSRGPLYAEVLKPCVGAPPKNL